jgi:hypothetical protein
MISRDILPVEFNSFYSVMKKHFTENYEKICGNVAKYLEKHPKSVKYSFDDMYRGMTVDVDFEYLVNLLKITKEKIETT